MATQRDIAEHLGISQPAVAGLVRDGVVAAAPRGGYDLDSARLAYCAHLREQAAGRAGREGAALDLATERARLAAAQAEAQERRNAHDRGELVRLEDVMGPMREAAAHAAQHLDRVPAIVAGHDHKLRKRIEQALNTAREMICDPAGYPAALRVHDDEGEDGDRGGGH